MKIHHLLEQPSIANTFIAELRDIEIQKNPMRFRKNIERLGEILGYELSKTLQFTSEEISTPLGKATHRLPEKDVVLCSILRAGFPLHNGLLDYFDQAENAFISAYRHHPNGDEKFEIMVDYLASPSLEGKTLILADPMLATGRSFVNVLKALKKMGTPKKIHLVAVIGAKEGLKLVQEEFPKNSELWIATIDDKLDKNGYIVPGLGDAGDLSYGPKLQH